MQKSLMDYVKKPATSAAAAVTTAGTEATRKRSRSPSPSSKQQHSSSATLVPTSSSRWLAALVMDPKWRGFLSPLMANTWRKGRFLAIEKFLDEREAVKEVVLPPRPDIFSAFNSAPFGNIKVVLLGQDPYHDIGQAHGLCFSVRPGVRPPPSLVNMYKELTVDIPGFRTPPHGYLQSWAEQGILMLNATLTVKAHEANSHSRCGWQDFTDDAIRLLSEKHPNRLVFLLWGNFARKKKILIDTTKHVVIESAHPSPLSARLWFGCKCFSQCNTTLEKLGHSPIDWQLPMTV